MTKRPSVGDQVVFTADVPEVGPPTVLALWGEYSQTQISARRLYTGRIVAIVPGVNDYIDVMTFRGQTFRMMLTYWSRE